MLKLYRNWERTSCHLTSTLTTCTWWIYTYGKVHSLYNTTMLLTAVEDGRCSTTPPQSSIHWSYRLTQNKDQIHVHNSSSVCLFEPFYVMNISQNPQFSDVIYYTWIRSQKPFTIYQFTTLWILSLTISRLIDQLINIQQNIRHNTFHAAVYNHHCLFFSHNEFTGLRRPFNNNNPTPM